MKFDHWARMARGATVAPGDGLLYRGIPADFKEFSAFAGGPEAPGARVLTDPIATVSLPETSSGDSTLSDPVLAPATPFGPRFNAEILQISDQMVDLVELDRKRRRVRRRIAPARHAGNPHEDRMGAAFVKSL